MSDLPIYATTMGPVRRAEDIIHVLREKMAILSGSRDRFNRPIIFFPFLNGLNVELLSLDNLRNVLFYLYNVTADDVKQNGFVVIIDMRKGATKSHVKPVLKALQEFFPGNLAGVYIIEPEKFLEKHKISMSAGKFKFEVFMLKSVESLGKYVDISQLIKEFGGTLPYDHDEWLELRIAIEKLIWKMTDIAQKFELYRNDMSNGELPVNVETAENATSHHQSLHKNIIGVSIEVIESEIQSIHNKITSSIDGFSAATLTTPNPDLAAIIPHITALGRNIARTREELSKQWEIRKQELEQSYQLKLFESDADRFFDYIRGNYGLLTQRFTEIGDSVEETERLMKEHHEFSTSVNNIEVDYSHIRKVAKNLIERQNFASQKIKSIDTRLEDEWNRFVRRIDERSKLLGLAISFHRKSSHYLINSPTWIKNCGVDPDSLPSQSAADLDAANLEHEHFGEIVEKAYLEAYDEGINLSQHMKKFCGDRKVGQIPSYKHVLEVIQRLAKEKREIYNVYHRRKVKFSCRISNIAFTSEVLQVIQWLEDHGEPFLRRKIGIGENLQQAKSLQNNHKKFQAVAQNTHSNAQQLFGVAQRLISSGECDIERTNMAVENLKQRIVAFDAKMELRTKLIHLSVLFHIHYTEIMNWYEHLDKRNTEYETIGATAEICEERQERFLIETDGTAQAYATVISEAQQLLNALNQQRVLLNVDNANSIRHIEGLRRNIEVRQEKEKDRWKTQRTCLQIGLKSAMYLRDFEEIRKQLINWREDLQGLIKSIGNKGEIIMHFHQQNTENVRAVILEAVSQMGEIVQCLDGNNLKLKTEDNQMVRDVVVASAQQLQQLEAEVMQIAAQVSDQIELSLHFNKLTIMATDTIGIIQKEENKLKLMKNIPGNLMDSETALDEFKPFENTLIKYVQPQVHNFERRIIDLHRVIVNLPFQKQLEDLREKVLRKFHQLIGSSTDRYKLLKTIMSYYQVRDNISPLLQTIERDYGTDLGDFCKLDYDESPEKWSEKMIKRINKHMNNKETFLEAATYAQKIAESLLKYLQRNHTASKEQQIEREKEVNETKEFIRLRVLQVMDLWTKRKENLEQCYHAVLIQANATKILTSIQIQNDNFLREKPANRSLPNLTREQLDENLEKCKNFKMTIKDQRHEVRRMLQHAETYLKNRLNDMHLHEIDGCMTAVKQRFHNFVNQVAEHEAQLQAAIDGTKINDFTSKKAKEELSLDRYSDCTIDERIQPSKEIENENNKRMRAPMNELIQSEKRYIEDLKQCIEIYLQTFRISGPQALKSREVQIFGNLEQLYKFHAETFLSELSAYENNPEDVGYCFIIWMERLKELYTEYLLNKEENNTMIFLPEAAKFFADVQRRHKVGPESNVEPLDSMVIKPVQRITKYQLLLQQLIQHCTTNVKDIKEAYDVMINIPKMANDRIHLKSFEDFEKHRIGEFVMSDTFTVFEPKRYFKRDREYHVFLFDSNLILCKKEELPTRKVRYIYKTHIMLCEVHIVEHVEGDNTKFGLRRGSLPNTDNTTIFKAKDEPNRILWVKTLREIMHDMKKISLDHLNNSSNRHSRTSQDSKETIISHTSIDDTSLLSQPSTSSSVNEVMLTILSEKVS